MERRVVVIGAGLGGISAAISLRQAGYEVELHEKNTHAGGKLNELKIQGYTFDLGPSILTLPHLFARLFERSGKRMADYIPIRAVRPHWRNFFEDGVVFDLYPEPDRMAAELEKLGPGLRAPFEAFLNYCGRQYDLVNRGYFEEGLDTAREFARFYEPSAVFRFDWLSTMHRSVASRLPEPHLVDAMDFFIKYVGSSAYDAPGFMNCLPTIQFRHDLWYVDGGMYGIARGLERLMREIGVQVRLGSEAVRIRAQGGRAMGVELAGGEFRPADVVVSNLEVIPAYRRLLGADERFLRSLRKFAPACSGLVLDLGLDCRYPQLAHHNFFFSGNQREHFRAVFREGRIPQDPTLYVVAASRTDPAVAPPGCDGLKILPHIPPLEEGRPPPREAYRALRDRVLDKLERMGLRDLRRHIVCEHLWTPEDIERQYGSNRGAIYGVVCDWRRNFAFKAPKQSRLYENLFFAGGSVNPGGGMPMVILCGQNVARRVAAWDAAR